MKYLGIAAKYLIICVFLAIYFGVFSPPDAYFIARSAPLQASDPFSTIVNGTLVIFLLIAGSFRWRPILTALDDARYILVLVGLAFLSVMWSVDPGVTFRRAGTLLVSTGFALYLCACFDFRDLVRLLTRVNFIVVAASFAIALVSGHLVQSAWGDNAWRGALIGKNNLGEAAALGIATTTCSLIVAANSRLLAGFTLLASVILLALSKSVTGGLEALVAVGAAGVGWLLQIRGPVRLALLSGVGLVAVFIIAAIALDLRDILAFLGRDETLTGRTELWDAVYREIQHRPLLGYGYGAFWSTNGVETLTIWSAVPWQPPNSHNSWLEIGLQLGLLGVVANAIAWFILFTRCVSVLNSRHDRRMIYWLVVASCLLLSSTSEIVMMRPGGYLWILFVITYVEASRAMQSLRSAKLMPESPVAMAT